jgi:hypothetical protein
MILILSTVNTRIKHLSKNLVLPRPNYCTVFNNAQVHYNRTLTNSTKEKKTETTVTDQRPSITNRTANPGSRAFEHFNCANDLFGSWIGRRHHSRQTERSAHTHTLFLAFSLLPSLPPPPAAGTGEDDDDAGPDGADGWRGGGRGGAAAGGERPRRAPGAALGGGDPPALRRRQAGAPLPAQPPQNPRARQDLR